MSGDCSLRRVKAEDDGILLGTEAQGAIVPAQVDFPFTLSHKEFCWSQSPNQTFVPTLSCSVFKVVSLFLLQNKSTPYLLRFKIFCGMLVGVGKDRFGKIFQKDIGSNFKTWKSCIRILFTYQFWRSFKSSVVNVRGALPVFWSTKRGCSPRTRPRPERMTPSPST